MKLQNALAQLTRGFSYVVKKGELYLSSGPGEDFDFVETKSGAFIWSFFDPALSYAEQCEGTVYKRFEDGFELRLTSFSHP